MSDSYVGRIFDSPCIFEMQDNSGCRVWNRTFLFNTSLVYGADKVLRTILGVDWGGLGTLDSSVTTAESLVEVETEHNSSGGAPVRQLFRGHLLANRLTSSNWSVSYDLTEVTGEKDPSASGAAVSLTMACSGTQNADVTITVHPINTNANQSAVTLKVRFFGGGKYA